MLSMILEQAANTDVPAGPGAIGLLLYVVIFGLIIYFLMIKPQKKQRIKTEEMHKKMEPGDNIMTTSGFYGTILDIVDDTTIIVEFGNNKNCRIPMHKNAVAELEKQGTAVEEE